MVSAQPCSCQDAYRVAAVNQWKGPIHTLTTHLEHQPLVHKVLLRRFVAIRKLVLLVVVLNEVLDDSTGLPECDAGIGVIDGGNATVDVRRLVGIFLEIGEFHKFSLVRDPKLLEDDCNLPRVRARSVRVESDWLAHCCDWQSMTENKRSEVSIVGLFVELKTFLVKRIIS